MDPSIRLAIMPSDRIWQTEHPSSTLGDTTATPPTNAGAAQLPGVLPPPSLAPSLRKPASRWARCSCAPATSLLPASLFWRALCFGRPPPTRSAAPQRPADSPLQAAAAPSYWAEALLAATTLINLLPTKMLHGSTPYFAVLGKHPDNSLHMFSCLWYLNLSSTSRHKLAPCSARPSLQPQRLSLS